MKYNNNIGFGIAEMIWGLSWANHMEEHDCKKTMPEIPDEVYIFTERVLGAYWGLNGMHEHALLWKALDADGTTFKTDLTPENLSEAEFNKLERHFGYCLAHMAFGYGVSWFDDHKKFDLRVPDCIEIPYIMWDLADNLCTVEKPLKTWAERVIKVK